MMLRCRSTSVPVETTAATQSMLGGFRVSGPDFMKEDSGASVKYDTNMYTLVKLYTAKNLYFIA